MSEQTESTPTIDEVLTSAMRGAIYLVCRFVGKVGASAEVERAADMLSELGSSTDTDYYEFLKAAGLDEATS